MKEITKIRDSNNATSFLQGSVDNKHKITLIQFLNQHSRKTINLT